MAANNPYNQWRNDNDTSNDDYVVDFEIPDVYVGMYTDGDYNVTVNLNKSDGEKDSYIFHFFFLFFLLKKLAL